MDLEHERRLTAVEDKAKSNMRRIEKLEESNEAINRLATSMEVMVVKQKEVAEKVDKMDEKVTILETKPAKRWEAIVDKIVITIAAAVIGFILAKIGM